MGVSLDHLIRLNSIKVANESRFERFDLPIKIWKKSRLLITAKNMETTKMSFNRRINKQTMVQPHNVILPSNKEK